MIGIAETLSMQLSILLVALLSSLSTQAAEPRAQVMQLDADFPIEALRGEGIAIRPLHQSPQRQEALPPNAQTRLFREADLTTAVKDWDALDRDRLLLRAEHQSSVEVAARYEGKIEEARIRRLQALIRKYRARQAR